MYDGPIIDAHHHIWEVRNYPWVTTSPVPRIFGTDYAALGHDYLVGDLLADFGANNVVKSVNMQGHWNGDPVDETAYLQSVADRHGFPHGIVGDAKLAAPDVERVLDRHMKHANFRGIRDVQHYMPGDRVLQAVDRPDACLAPEWRRGVRALGARGLVCELQGFPHQYEYFAEIVAENPDMRFCLVHCGMLVSDDAATYEAWRAALPVLARFRNIWVKCAAVNTFSRGGPKPMHLVGRRYNALLDLFGADRCFFASNFPVEKLRIGYDDLIAMVKAAVFHRPAQEQRAFFHDAAAEFYRI